MLLQARHTAENGAANVVLISPHTDVAVPPVAMSHKINSTMVFRTGTQHRTRYVYLSEIGAILGQDICAAFIGHHAFTGCYATSAFVGRGKAQRLNLVNNNEFFQNTMKQ